MDLFVGVQKIARDGRVVPFVHHATLENGPLALGWLRVIVQGRDLVTAGPPDVPLLRHEGTRNKGMHVIHTGGAHIQ